jgi:hypothetical protein
MEPGNRLGELIFISFEELLRKQRNEHLPRRRNIKYLSWLLNG